MKSVVLAIAGFFLSAIPLQADSLKITWTNNMLSIKGDKIPGGSMDVWYLEAFCRGGSTTQKWDQTTISHKTELLHRAKDQTKLRLGTTVEPNVFITHDIEATEDEVRFTVIAKNTGKEFADVQWFQPCPRVDKFTGKKQNDYITKSFIFTKDGLKRLSELPREEEAIYKGGQVYVPEGIPLNDVNPRPISKIKPVNGLIGAFSEDEKMLWATAWSDTQELFQGVIVCLHNDPRVGGLKPGGTKKLTGRIYILPNDPNLLLKRYNHDFPKR